MFSFRSVQATRYIVLFLICAGLMAVFMGGIVYAAGNPLEVYNNASYGGMWCYSVSAGPNNIASDCNDQVSSVALLSGWSVRLYRDPNQSGPSQCFSASDANLTDNTYNDGSPMNDTASSFILYQQSGCPPLEVHNNADYTGSWCYSVGAGPDNIAASCNDQVSSFLLQPGWSIRLYRDANQGGPSRCFTGSDPNLTDNTYEDGSAINDTASSFNLYAQASCPVPPNPILQVSLTSLNFSATQGGGNPAAQSFTITNGGTGTLSWTASDNASWLSLSSSAGTAPSNVNALVNISGLNAGTYNGQITVSSEATGSPKTVGVTLNLAPASNNLSVRYVDQVYVQKTPECSPGCYWNHCGPASLAMVLHHQGREIRDVLNDRQATLDLVCEAKPNCKGGTNPTLLRDTLRNHGVPVDEPDWMPTFAEIKQSIDNGFPVVLSIREASHVTVVTGYRNNNIVILNDPFGGVSWWNTGQTNAPYTGSPKLTGNGVEYTYESNLHGFYAIFREGSRSLPAPTNKTITSAGGTLISTGIQVDFSPFSILSAQSPTLPITVTYTPQFSSPHNFVGFEASVNMFRLNAIDTNQQTVQEFYTPYTFRIQVDPFIIDNWHLTTGVTHASNSNEIWEINPVKFTLAAWDNNLQQWVTIPSAFDSATNSLVAQYSQFTEFAVFVQHENEIYLPIIIK